VTRQLIERGLVSRRENARGTGVVVRTDYAIVPTRLASAKALAAWASMPSSR
jgi:hypothetical protein